MRVPTLSALATELARGRATSRALVDECLVRIDDVSGEGRRVFLDVDREAALAAADAMDLLHSANAPLSPFAGIPISVKDLFDVAGQVTRAGSRVLEDRPPARRDAVSVARLRRAGFVLIGRTNMTEFAFSGLGINPHYDTPRNSWERHIGRIPGGSSSGAAVSVTDGMAHGALGTDTGGSCRIPAAFTGLVGYKSTAARIPLDGVIPLSFTLDSVGVMARSVACCAAMGAVLAGDVMPDSEDQDVSGLRLGALRTIVLDAMDTHVSRAYAKALSRISAAGAHVREVEIPALHRIPEMNRRGGFAAAESFAWHRAMIDERAALYDPRVLSRIRRGAEQNATDYVDLLAARRSLIAAVSAGIDDFDALLFPTVPIVAPRLTECESDENYTRLNLVALRNSTVVNMIDGCAVSIPIHEPDQPPVGLTVAMIGGQDHRVLRVAAAVERALTVQ